MWRLWKLMTVLVTQQCNWNIRDLINSETCHLKPSAEVVSSWWFPCCDFLFMLCCAISFTPLWHLLHFALTKYYHCGNSLRHKTELRTLVSPDFFPSCQPLLLTLFFLWLENKAHAGWVVGWLNFFRYLRQGQRNIGILSLCAYV